MKPDPLYSPSVTPGASLAARVVAFSLVFAPLVTRELNAQPAPPPVVADAAMVPPAPILQKPLTPAGADVMLPQPSPRHVWIAGHWRWNNGQYGWVAGSWELPPVENAVWVGPHWEFKGNGYVLIDGYWQQTVSTQVVVEAPPPPPAPEVVVVDEAPPPPVREVIVERPGRDYIWVGGYWSWSHGRHFWNAGHWERPPHANAVWVEPRWDRRGNGYVFVQGFWREAGRETGVSVGVSLGHNVGIGIAINEPRHEERHEEVIIREGPPSPPAHYEYQGRPPSPRYVWIAGYWAWHHGRNEWIEGHWELPPRERAVWVEPRWERRQGGYVFIEGSWR